MARRIQVRGVSESSTNETDLIERPTVSNSFINVDPDELSHMFEDGGNRKILEKFGQGEGLCDLFGSDRGFGLAALKIEEHKHRYGENRLPPRPQTSLFSFYLDALSDKVMIILIFASIISIVLGATVRDEDTELMNGGNDSRKTGWIEGVAIMVAVQIVSLVSSINDYIKDKKFRKLEEQKDNRLIKVTREGQEQRISIYDVVVGDLVNLETGDFIPVDAVLLEGHSYSIDESSLTGESDSVNKTIEKDPFFFSGCKVMAGSGVVIACAVGIRSQWGQLQCAIRGNEDNHNHFDEIKQKICCCCKANTAVADEPQIRIVKKDDEEEKEVEDILESKETPLQTKLGDMSEKIALFGLVAALLAVAVLVIEFIIRLISQDEEIRGSQFTALVGYFITGLTILVVAVPEGLPLAVTIALAYSMQKMMKDNNLVRHLQACETMGGATNICSDKTGTLTENRMTVVELWIDGTLHSQPEKCSDSLSSETLRLLTDGICINSTAYIDTHSVEGKEDFVGSKTECALLVFAKKLNADYSLIRKQWGNQIALLLPFSSASKQMSTVVRTDQREHTVYVKGAAEIILNQCSTRFDSDGNSVSLSQTDREDILHSVVEAMASRGLRTLCLAANRFNNSQREGKERNEEELEEITEADIPINDLGLVGIVGIKDPVRESVPAAVRDCVLAGITVRMVTGDNILTAQHIARECGILTDNGCALTGPELRTLTVGELDDVLLGRNGKQRLQVVARCSPTDKLLLVNRLRRLGEVVASTGDGTNDAPQLRAADVGFAMNIAGTEVAKEAADILLLDDNFTSVVKAVSWGRNVYDSIRKFIQFQLTVNVVAVFIAVIGAIVYGFSPITAMQLLWVNLIMDTLAALALATDAPSPALLKRPPYGRYQSIITTRMGLFVGGHSLLQFVVLMILLCVAEKMWFFDGLPPRSEWINGRNIEHTTIIFNTFVFMQFFNEINARKLNGEWNVFRGIFSNFLFVGIMVLTVCVQIVIIFFGGKVFQTEQLSAKAWLGCFIFSFVELPYNLLLVFIPLPEKWSEIPIFSRFINEENPNIASEEIEERIADKPISEAIFMDESLIIPPEEEKESTKRKTSVVSFLRKKSTQGVIGESIFSRKSVSGMDIMEAIGERKPYSEKTSKPQHTQHVNFAVDSEFSEDQADNFAE